jgi:hypothetical protein
MDAGAADNVVWIAGRAGGHRVREKRRRRRPEGRDESTASREFKISGA